MKRYYFLFLVLGTLLPVAILDAQQTPFSTVYYDMNSSVKANAFAAAPGGGYIIAGERSGGGLIMEMDSLGNIAWLKKLGDQYYNFFTCITPTYDAGYALAGNIYNPDLEIQETLIVKTDADGDTLWCRSFNPGTSSSVSSILECTNHDLIVTGNANSSQAPNVKILVARLSESGVVRWVRTFSALNNYNIGQSARETGNDTFIITGYAEDINPFHSGMNLMKISGTGEVLWSRLYTDVIYNDLSAGSDLRMIGSEMYILMISYNGGNTNLMKTDLEGNPIWCYRFWTNNWLMEQIWPKLQLTADNHLVFVTPGQWGQLVKAGLDGQIEWSTGLFLQPVDVVETSGKGLMAVGNGPIYGVKKANSNPHIGLILTDSTGTGMECTDPVFPISTESVTFDITPLTVTVEDHFTVSTPLLPILDAPVSTRPGCVDFIGGMEDAQTNNGTLHIYPNPASESFRLDLPGGTLPPDARLRIIDNQGRQVAEFNTPRPLYDISALPEGLYTILLIAGRESWGEKMVVGRR